MAPERPKQGSVLARSILLRLIGFAGVVVLVVATVAIAHGVLEDRGAAVETGTNFPGLIVIGLALAGLAMIVSVGAQVARSIATPIHAVTETMQALAAGTLDAANPGQQRADEIGDMARAAEVFRATAIELQRKAAQQAHTDGMAAADRRHALNAMAEAIERETSIVVAKLADQAKAGVAVGEIDGLLRLVREGVGRAVRTASGAVERRQWPRIRVTGAASIEIDGDSVTAPIIDVSAGGIRVGCALTAQVGHRCRVRLPGVTPELPAEILAVSQTEARLRFEIDEITRSVVNEMLANRAGERASAA